MVNPDGAPAEQPSGTPADSGFVSVLNAWGVRCGVGRGAYPGMYRAFESVGVC
jgi:hypothetical protein